MISFILCFLSFLSSSVSNPESVSTRTESFTSNFLFLVWLSLEMLHPDQWAIYFQSSGLPLSFSGAWSYSVHRFHITLQVLQAFVLMHSHISINVRIITPLENPLPFVALGMNDFNHPWTYQVSYVYLPAAWVPPVLSKFLAEHFTGQFRLLILPVPCWIEAPWFSRVLHMLENIPYRCPIRKDLIMDVSVSSVLKGLPSLHLSLWLFRDVSCTDKGFLPKSVSQWQE